MGISLSHQAQKIAAALPSLLIEAEQVASVVQQGVHGRRRAGTGETFWQFRRYMQGDSSDRIDWRQSARSDKLFIREREWEAAQKIYLWADGSGSMHYTSSKEDPTKAERGQILMLALATLLFRGGEKPSFLLDSELSVRSRESLENVASRFETWQAPLSLPPDVSLATAAHVVLASDFLMPPQDLDNLMQRYMSLRLKGVLLHVLDRAEEDLNFQGRVRLEGLEGEDPLILPNAAAFRAQYAAKMESHKLRLRQMAEKAGWFYTCHVTHAKPTLVLMQLFERLRHGGS